MKRIIVGIFIVLYSFALLYGDSSDWMELNKQVLQLVQERKYEQALPLAEEVFKIAEETVGDSDAITVSSIKNLGIIYQNLNRYQEAESCFQRVIAIREKNLGLDHPEVAEAMENLALFYYNLSRYSEAESLFRRTLTIREKSLGENHSEVAITLSNLAATYDNLGRYPEAETSARRALDILEANPEAKPKEVAEGIATLAGIYLSLYRYPEAESLYLKALTIQESQPEVDSFQIAYLLNNLALSYCGHSEYKQAEALYQRALIIFRRVYGPDHPEVATCLINLSQIQLERGHYTSAESLFQQALDIKIRFLGDNHPDVAICLNNLGNVYSIQGRYTEAQDCYSRALKIRDNNYGFSHPRTADSYSFLGDIYKLQGRYAEAVSLYLSALEIHTTVFGAAHPNVAQCLLDLARTYQHIPEKKAQVEPLYRQALDISQNYYKGNHEAIVQNLNSLGTFYLVQKRYADAEPLFDQARIFIERIYGLDNLKLASIISNQAFIYENQGCLSEAESLYVKALAMKKKWLGPDHPSLVINLSNLAIFYYLQGRLSDADPLMDECLANLAFQFNRLFPYYSEKNKDDYLNVFSETFSKYYSYAYRAYPTDPRISGKMLNLSLWRKGMIVSSQSAVIRRISSLADTSATAILQQFRSTREELVKLCLSQTDTSIAGRKRQTVLEQESEALERRLSLISSQSIHSPRIDSIKWQDIAAALKPNQAAIDFLAFRLYNQHWTDTIFYCALIVTHAGRQPVLVMLGTESQLNHLLNFEYKSMIHQQTYHRFDQPGRLYEMIWKPLEPYLKGINKIYLSPDGMLNSVSFGILVDQQGKMLIDDFEIHYMSNLSDLVKVNHRENGFPNRDWVLIGNPTFKADETEIRGIWSAEALPADSTRQSSRLDNLTRTHLSELPWTQTEIDSICSLLQADHQPVTVFTKLKATEENLKGILAPKVLHIATHGFFMPAAERVDSLPDGGNEGDHDMFRNNPLLRSGLYLAGASNRLSERGLNDGILFAHEAVDLDLQATELVVLSACETGVGEVRTGEGVYGLRRAFQIAGAQSVMMSLWPVPDQETQELMTRFYRKLLQHANPYSALREAQQEQRRIVRERYRKEVPFYWGAFILVGGPSGE